jgi:hypothetical protein
MMNNGPILFRNSTEVLLLSILLCLFIGCENGSRAPKGQPEGKGKENSSGSPDLSFPVYAKVKVDKTGEIFLDGKNVTLDELKPELAKLRRAHGAVRYHREDPGGQPDARQLAAIKAVMAAIIAEKLPKKLEAKDFE